MLRRLEAGLADEGVRVLHAVPEDTGPEADAQIFTREVPYAAVGPFRRLGQVSAEVSERVAAAAGGPPDVVHAFGGKSWPLAHAVAAGCGAGLVLEIWRAGLAPALRRVRELPHQGRGLIASVPGEALERSVREEAPGIHIERVPWGVLAPSDLPPPAGGVRSLMFTGSGRDAEGFHAAFDGATRAADASGVEWMAFVDADLAKRVRLWRRIEHTGLRERVSLIDGMESRRDLVLRGDLLIQAEALGEHRSLLLEAMAWAMSVVVRPDPMVGSLVNGTTCVFVGEPTVPAWERAILPLLEDPARATQIGTSARQFVREHHKASAQVAALLRCYEAAGAGRVIPFSGS